MFRFKSTPWLGSGPSYLMVKDIKCCSMLKASRQNLRLAFCPLVYQVTCSALCLLSQPLKVLPMCSLCRQASVWLTWYGDTKWGHSAAGRGGGGLVRGHVNSGKRSTCFLQSFTNKSVPRNATGRGRGQTQQVERKGGGKMREGGGVRHYMFACSYHAVVTVCMCFLMCAGQE